MEKHEIVAMIRDEVRKAVNIILSGQSGTNDQFSETINNLFPGMAGIPTRPVMHPYGFVSRAPEGTIAVTAKQGDHAGNRIVLGHRDGNRPALLSGEAVIYNQFGRAVKVLTSKILIGGDDSTENIVLGQVFKTMMSSLLTALEVETHIDSLGYNTQVPTNESTYATLKASPIDNSEILSDESFARKSGGS